MSYDRTTTRLVEKNCRAYRLFTQPAPTSPPATAGGAADSTDQATGSAA